MGLSTAGGATYSAQTQAQVRAAQAAQAERERGKIWSITSDYENLLQNQSEHFAATIKNKDREIALFKEALNESMKGDGDESFR